MTTAAPQMQPQITPRNVVRPQTQVQTETHATKMAEIFISEYLGKEVYRFLLDTGQTLHNQKKTQLSEFDIFLGLLKIESFRAKLQELTPDRLRVEEALLRAGVAQEQTVSDRGRLYFTPGAKQLLLSSYLYAQGTAGQIITLEHVWNAAVKMPGIFQAVYGDQAPVPSVEADPDPRLDTANEGKPVQPGLQETAPTVARLTENLTARFMADPARPIIDREKEINQIFRVITRQDKNSCLLLGENGTGKSAVVEGLAYELVYNQAIPEYLKDYKVLMLNFSSLIASAEYPGSNLPGFMDELNTLGKVILFVEGIRFNDVSQEGFVLNTFLNLVFRNKSIVVIIATDPAFYRSTLEKNELFREHFDTVLIDEPPYEALLQILTKEAAEISHRQQVQIDPALFDEVIELSKRYLASAHFPQKAIALIEEAATAARIDGQQAVTSETLKRILSEKLGIPLQSISVSDRQKLLALESNLNAKVIGQQHAVREVVEAIKRSRAGLKDQKKPIGSFLFLGPSGVGKTELAKQLAEQYYDDERAFVRLDMSEYGEQHTSQRLIGAPPGYAGYEEGGQFTNPIQLKPYSLILLDEIEKAHPKIFDIFLQVLDEGRLTDSRGKLADYRNAILIFTSNIAADVIFNDLATPAPQLRADPKSFYEQKIMPELLKNFRPEFINRFDEVVPFNPLGIPELAQIAKLKVRRIQDNLAERQIQLITPDEELTKLVQAAYDPRFGARPIERLIKDVIETPIAQQIIAGGLKPGTVINWKYQP
ncbi:MAG: ATP-dependent Clp protease ATP-binding subunit ClpC [candidate division WS6 bacterium OLB20]|uniref:ATP-dependent Clp protease ATP-binding subunit ClpC n=1 Tax=candidate division WS6 bacterium OLB20 TaxID=1617426 RepID=A0A136LWW0_9BACT|nr:MAG: ATP-dependent Clp protease ATP-binding subunit ClpC [candidate division WS6 bacterium OLB20]